MDMKFDEGQMVDWENENGETGRGSQSPQDGNPPPTLSRPARLALPRYSVSIRILEGGTKLSSPSQRI